MKGKLPPRTILAECERLGNVDGVVKFEKLLDTLLAHPELGDSAPEMQLILTARARLKQFALICGAESGDIPAAFEERKNVYLIAMQEALARQEKLEAPVRELARTFTRRYLECVAVTSVCAAALRKKFPPPPEETMDDTSFEVGPAPVRPQQVQLGDSGKVQRLPRAKPIAGHAATPANPAQPPSRRAPANTNGRPAAKAQARPAATDDDADVLGDVQVKEGSSTIVTSNTPGISPSDDNPDFEMTVTPDTTEDRSSVIFEEVEDDDSLVR